MSFPPEGSENGTKHNHRSMSNNTFHHRMVTLILDKRVRPIDKVSSGTLLTFFQEVIFSKVKPGIIAVDAMKALFGKFLLSIILLFILELWRCMQTILRLHIIEKKKTTRSVKECSIISTYNLMD